MGYTKPETKKAYNDVYNKIRWRDPDKIKAYNAELSKIKRYEVTLKFARNVLYLRELAKTENDSM